MNSVKGCAQIDGSRVVSAEISVKKFLYFIFPHIKKRERENKMCSLRGGLVMVAASSGCPCLMSGVQAVLDVTCADHQSDFFLVYECDIVFIP